MALLIGATCTQASQTQGRDARRQPGALQQSRGREQTAKRSRDEIPCRVRPSPAQGPPAACARPAAATRQGHTRQRRHCQTLQWRQGQTPQMRQGQSLQTRRGQTLGARS